MSRADALSYPWTEPPEHGEAVEVAEGVLWIRLPLPMALDHVNVYALDDGDSWTIVDTGVKSSRSIEIWESALKGPLRGRPVGRVILTHYHPDHVGMAGWLMERFGAELATSRTTWALARMLILDVEERPSPQSVAFWRAAGIAGEVIAAREADRPFNFADVCAPIPMGFTQIRQGDAIRAGGREWDVHFGDGHAPDHLTLWSRSDDLVLIGDQAISSISPNIGVYPSEPDADPLAEWLDSCRRLSTLAQEGHLALSGHKLPFRGLQARLLQIVDGHKKCLTRLCRHLRTPRTAVQCFVPLFGREIESDSSAYGMAVVEAVAHLNHLRAAGRAERALGDDGAWMWRAAGRAAKG